MITIHLNIKFRTMGVTMWTFDKKFEVHVGVPVPSFDLKVLYHDRGVYLAVWA